MRRSYLIIFAILMALVVSYSIVEAKPVDPAQSNSIVQILYFYSTDCQHCQVVEEEVLLPLEQEYDSSIEIIRIEISDPDAYELLIKIEEFYKVSPEERLLPNLIIGDNLLIGETEIRENLSNLIDEILQNGESSFAEIDGLDAFLSSIGENGLESGMDPFSASETEEFCTTDEEGCETNSPIWIAYFYQTGCQACSRVEADLEYIRSRFYPQIIIEEFNINDHLALGNWMAENVNREDYHTPVLFVGDDALVGEEEITLDRMLNTFEKYAESGAEKVWENFNEEEARESVVSNFSQLKPLTVVFAGLLDGLNPCAFATLIFFVSYLTVSGRKGKEVLFVGIAFTIGVFTAYFVIGLGFYKVLDLLGDFLTTLGKWVYGFTAVLCLVLAFFSFRDYFKVRDGDIGDMDLKLPEPIRKRINSVIRKGKNARAYIIGAFITGVLISFLELACTGQVYLPTIIFVSSIPELRGQATLYLGIYNLFFIVPLIVVFILAYYGTTSQDLKKFLEKNAGPVKLGLGILFAVLAIWLGFSIFS